MKSVLRNGIVATLAAAAIAVGLPLCAGVSFADGGSSGGGNPWEQIFSNNSGGGNCDFGNDGDFQKGDILVSTQFGDVLVYNSAGVLQRTLSPTGTNAPVLNGEGFDLSGNLYVTEFSSDQTYVPPGTVFKYSPSGKLLGTFGSGYVANEESIAFDSSGDVFVGAPDDMVTVGSTTLALIREFDKSGNPVTPTGQSNPGFLVTPDTTGGADGGADYVALGADNCTLYYANEGDDIQTYNVCTETQGGVFNQTPMPAGVYEMVALPNSLGGGLLAAAGTEVVQFDSSGNAVKTFSLPGSTMFYALALDPSGKSFWAGDIVDGELAEFDLATGNVITSFSATPNPPSGTFGGVSGLAIVGAPQAIASHDCDENGDYHSGHDDDDSGWLQNGDDHDDQSDNGNCYGHYKDHDDGNSVWSNSGS